MRSLLLVWAWLICSGFSAQAAIVVLNGLTHIHNAASGTELQGKIRLKNDGKGPARILIYRQDLVAECGKSLDYVNDSGGAYSLSRWLNTNVDEKTLSAGEEYEVIYTVKIPRDEVANGSYWQVLMVEGAEPVKEETIQGVSVNSKVRYAIQLVVNVGGFESPAIAFENVDVKKGDKPSLAVTLKNSGKYTAVVRVILELYDEQGGKVKKLESTGRRVYPSFCNSFVIDLDGIPAGKFAGVLIADNGTDLFGSNLSLEL
ncbi:hypothetical protein GCM10023091_07800 [Ravibacter arvi]|uniref:DUF3324 domain-containing protein n=1 Tax=Ravibacter arvi TaxID=2051041 RepID=A0ABP8LRM6_9BACT